MDIYEFKTKVSNVRLSSKLIDKGYSMDSIVTISANATIYKSPKNINFLDQEVKVPNKHVSKIVEYHKALAIGSPKSVLLNWVKSDREKKSKMINDPSMFKRVQAHYKSNSILKILGIIQQKKSYSILVYMGGFISSMTIIEANNKLFLTDSSPDDLQLAIIEGSFLK
jgi:uncharacterized protein (DUF488 family)